MPSTISTKRRVVSSKRAARKPSRNTDNKPRQLTIDDLHQFEKTLPRHKPISSTKLSQIATELANRVAAGPAVAGPPTLITTLSAAHPIQPSASMSTVWAYSWSTRVPSIMLFGDGYHPGIPHSECRIRFKAESYGGYLFVGYYFGSYFLGSPAVLNMSGPWGVATGSSPSDGGTGNANASRVLNAGQEIEMLLYCRDANYLSLRWFEVYKLF